MTSIQNDYDARLTERLGFIELDARTLGEVVKVKWIIDREISTALDKFYAKLRETPQVRRFFLDEHQIGRAKGAQAAHWGGITSGEVDERYVERVRRVGLTHARIGLEPRWYIGGYAHILEHLIKSVVSELWPKTAEGGDSRRAAADVGSTLAALAKAVLLDIDLSTSVYIDAAEAKLKAEAAAQAKERQELAKSIGTALQNIAAKNLTFRLNNALPEAYKKLEADFNGALDQIEGALREVRASTHEIETGTGEIASASDELSRRAEEQAASLEQTTAAVAEITSTVQKTAEASRHVREAVSSANAAVKSSSDVIRMAVATMSKVEESSKQVGAIIGVINDIAMQTNLLSLNAAVEAARAGESGRGFAVVAAEVRSLAHRSATAAKEIQAIVTSSSTVVAQGVKLVNQTGESLAKISSNVGEINTLVDDIARRAQDQASALKQVNDAVNQMDQATQRNAAMAEEATAATQSLAGLCQGLAALVTEFEVGASGAGGAHARIGWTPGPTKAA